MYFVINDLVLVEPTYVWALEFFINLYERSIKESPIGKDNRNKNIIDTFMRLFY